jgi:hypothetical protein
MELVTSHDVHGDGIEGFVFDNGAVIVTRAYPVAICFTLTIKKSSYEPWWYSAGLRAGRSGFDSRRGLGIFLFITAFRTALGPTQPPMQWVVGILPWG